MAKLSTKRLAKEWEPALSPSSQTGEKWSWFGCSVSHSLHPAFCESSKQLWTMSFSLPSPQPSVELVQRKLGSCAAGYTPNSSLFIAILSSSGQVQSSWKARSMRSMESMHLCLVTAGQVSGHTFPTEGVKSIPL